MTDREQIRAEIERRINKLNKPFYTPDTPCGIALQTYKEMLSFIDSLQEEPLREEKLSNVERNGKNWKEPISEDLDSFATKYAQDKPYPVTVCQAVKVGANWQKEQFEKNRLKHCNSITNEQAELEQGFLDQHFDKYQCFPIFLDAIEYGIRLQKQQLMAKAIEVTIAIPYSNGNGGYTQLVDSKKGLPFGDKVKVIVIKED